MIAYNSNTIKNISIVKKARQWYANRLINSNQLKVILNHYQVDFYSPGLPVKIGLFIFTCFLVFATVGLYSLLFYKGYDGDNSGFVLLSSLLFATASIVALEMVIKKRKTYRSGIEEALQCSFIVFLLTAFFIIFENVTETNSRTLTIAIFVLPILMAAAVRYASLLISILTVICVYTITFLLIMKLGDVAKMIIPFAMMLLSGGLYYTAKRLKTDKNFCWEDCIEVMEVIALLIFYVACNYFVIRESSILFFGMILNEGQDIPLAFVFYLLTACVPLLYIYFGLKQKNRTLLWMGLILVAAAVLTFKYYFSLGHPEITLTIVGLILVAVAYFSIRYLKTPHYGLTYEEDVDEENFFKTNAEALLIAQTFSSHAPESKPQGFEGFGGGQGGGGGASGNF